jgi:hypothetical protein
MTGSIWWKILNRVRVLLIKSGSTSISNIFGILEKDAIKGGKWITGVVKEKLITWKLRLLQMRYVIRELY